MAQPKSTTTKTKAAVLWLVAAAVMVMVSAAAAEVEDQARLLNKGCSQYNATDRSDFFAKLGAMLTVIGVQLSGGRRFATAQYARGSDPVYAMAQCRNYLSDEGCSACLAAAESQIRNCSAANGARVIYDGCFLRYESSDFFDQTTLPGNVGICGKQKVPQSAATFTSTVESMLLDLLAATPKIPGFFAATSATENGGGSATSYGVAQCVETLTERGCADCLRVAFDNLDICLPDSDGRAIDAGCFLRYSNASFFPDNQTTNLASLLKPGGSNKKAIIGGVVGGFGGVLLIVIIGIFIWFKTRKPQTNPRDNTNNNKLKV